jgi:hypothetical protein
VIAQPPIQLDRSAGVSILDRIKVSSRAGYSAFGAGAFWRGRINAEREYRAPHAMRD